MGWPPPPPPLYSTALDDGLRALRQPHARARAPMPLRLPRAAAAASLLLPHHHHRWFPHAPATQRVLVRVAWTKRRPRCTSHSPSPQARAAVACCICLLVLAALRCPRSPSAMTRNFARMRPLLPRLVKSQVKQGKRLIVCQGKAVPQVWGLGFGVWGLRFKSSFTSCTCSAFAYSTPAPSRDARSVTQALHTCTCTRVARAEDVT